MEGRKEDFISGKVASGGSLPDFRVWRLLNFLQVRKSWKLQEVEELHKLYMCMYRVYVQYTYLY